MCWRKVKQWKPDFYRNKVILRNKENDLEKATQNTFVTALVYYTEAINCNGRMANLIYFLGLR